MNLSRIAEVQVKDAVTTHFSIGTTADSGNSELDFAPEYVNLIGHVHISVSNFQTLLLHK